jgi:hypothetical protein
VDHEEFLVKELDEAKSNGTEPHVLAQIGREIEGVRKRIKRLKVPPGYQSWEHLKALCEFRKTLKAC